MDNPSAYPKIEALLPHRSRMLLIDEIVEIDGGRAVSKSTPNDQWPSSDGDQVSPLMIIELVAQTSGLSNGLECLNAEGGDTEVRGWLVGVKKAVLNVRSIPLGQAVITETRNSFEFEGFREIDGLCRIGDTIIGQAVLQVVRAE